MTVKKVFVVTGSNKGIGKSIVKQLVLNASKYNSSEFIIFATSRDLSLGEKVVEEFKELYKKELLNYRIELKPYQLDISNYQQVDQFKDFLVQSYQGVDVLINNAGIASFDVDFQDRIPLTLQVNFYATLNVIHTFLPIIKSGGRIISVASAYGLLKHLPEEAASKFINPNLSVEKVVQLMENYIQSVRTNTLKENLWPEQVDRANVYKISKVHLIAFNYALQMQTDPRQKFVAACCPGHCATDMNDHKGTRSPDQGALTPVHLALQDLDALIDSTKPQNKVEGLGVFWQDLAPFPWNSPRD